MGEEVPLTVDGLYDDNVTREITTSNSDTTYISSNPEIVEISSKGFLKVKSTGEAIVTIENSGAKKEITVIGESVPADIKAGWNLLSLYLEPLNTNIDSVLAGIKDKIASAWKWEDDNWSVYLPDFSQEEVLAYISPRGFNQITDISSGEGFWVNSDTEQNLTVQATLPANPFHILASGWNLIGRKNNETQLITDYISGNVDSIISIWKWDNNKANWAVYLPGGGTEEYATVKGFQIISMIDPGDGIWVNCTEPITLE